MKIRIKTFNGETINTRDQARKAVQAVKSQFDSKRVIVKLSDNSNSGQRWGVTIENNHSKTLSVSRKPKGNTFASMQKETCHNAVQWLKDKPSKVVNVWVKSSKLQHTAH